MFEIVVLLLAVVFIIKRNIRNERNWRDYYSAGKPPAWATGSGPYVSWAGVNGTIWCTDVANDVGLVRLALSLEPALTLALPELSEQLQNETPLVAAAGLVYHLHCCLGAPITTTRAAEMALMVYYDVEYLTDPVGTTSRVVSQPVLSTPCAPPAWKTPLLLALGTQLARPLVAPQALRQQPQATQSTGPVDARKTE
jgi:hypothetical protein